MRKIFGKIVLYLFIGVFFFSVFSSKVEAIGMNNVIGDEVLNKYSDKILCVKGNCDAEVDEMISDFKFEENIELDISNKKFFLTHNYILNYKIHKKDVKPITSFYSNDLLLISVKIRSINSSSTTTPISPTLLFLTDTVLSWTSLSPTINE